MTVEERFNVKWEPEPYSGCWLWVASIDSNGYGQFRNGRCLEWAHRASWMLNKGEIPVGICVLHKCDTPVCVNPDHLFLGTQSDNTRDCIRKGRHIRGSKVGTSKLTEQDVLAIRSDTRSKKEIAISFGVSSSAIGLIKSRKRWSYLR